VDRGAPQEGPRRSEALSALDAVLAAPDDDDARLVYADALLERGDPLGEFIQVSIRLEREGGSALERRRDVLLAEHRAAWLAPLEKAARADAWSFRRGLPAVALYSGDDAIGRLVSDAPAIFRLAPLEELALSATFYATSEGEPGRGSFELRHVEALAAAPWLPRIRALAVRAQPCGAERVLFASPGLTGLRSLALSDCAAAACDGLAASSHLGALESLSLSDRELGPEAASILATARLGGLRHLRLDGCRVGRVGRKTLKRLAPEVVIDNDVG
jgi:uncharacterized protein (TIGR02996 family)